jgi:hypothetical protein
MYNSDLDDMHTSDLDSSSSSSIEEHRHAIDLNVIPTSRGGPFRKEIKTRKQFGLPYDRPQRSERTTSLVIDLTDDGPTDTRVIINRIRRDTERLVLPPSPGRGSVDSHGIKLLLIGSEFDNLLHCKELVDSLGEVKARSVRDRFGEIWRDINSGHPLEDEKKKEEKEEKKEKKEKKEEKDENEECCVCFEPFSKKPACKYPCNHEKVCYDCTIQITNFDLPNSNQPTLKCPLCREVILFNDIIFQNNASTSTSPPPPPPPPLTKANQTPKKRAKVRDHSRRPQRTNTTMTSTTTTTTTRKK